MLQHLPWFTRRQVLAGGSMSAATFTLPTSAASQASSPPGNDGFATLRAETGNAPLRGAGNPATPIWGFGGATPGPVLRVKRGQELKVRLVNELAERTAVHWHGVRLSNAMDGVPHLTQAPVTAGASFDYRFVPPDSGTFWYHAYPTEQAARGLHGALIVDEPEPADVDRDVALVLANWRLAADGAVDATQPAGLGKQLTANGMPVADIPVKTNERLRLRFINAAAARIMI